MVKIEVQRLSHTPKWCEWVRPKNLPHCSTNQIFIQAKFCAITWGRIYFGILSRSLLGIEIGLFNIIVSIVLPFPRKFIKLSISKGISTYLSLLDRLKCNCLYLFIIQLMVYDKILNSEMITIFASLRVKCVVPTHQQERIATWEKLASVLLG